MGYSIDIILLVMVVISFHYRWTSKINCILLLRKSSL